MGGPLSREDVIVVASVSCIYGLGSPEDYEGMMLRFRVNYFAWQLIHANRTFALQRKLNVISYSHAV